MLAEFLMEGVAGWCVLKKPEGDARCRVWKAFDRLNGIGHAVQFPLRFESRECVFDLKDVSLKKLCWIAGSGSASELVHCGLECLSTAMCWNTVLTSAAFDVDATRCLVRMGQWTLAMAMFRTLDLCVVFSVHVWGLTTWCSFGFACL